MKELSIAGKVIFGVLIIGAITGLALTSGDREQEMEAKLYAEMVCVGRETNNEFGWPNYLNLDINCE
jgi:hypothetical protein